jgi:uncharacterized protein (TIGR03437 family)
MKGGSVITRISAGKQKVVSVAALILTAVFNQADAQTTPPVILEVDVENYVQYWADVTDPTKLASTPTQTTATGRAFMENVWVADVVAVNGTPARGTFVSRTQSFSYRPTPAPGQHIADINRNGGPTTEALEILLPDGTPVGTIVGTGFVAGTAPPGSPRGLMFSNVAVIGGTGAFLGVKGQCGIAMASGVRNASQSEDPSLRRTIGGGKMRMILHLIPAIRPEIVSLPDGPAVVHSADYTLVTAAAPAHKGEILSIVAKGLGPTRMNAGIGTPFPSDPLAVVNSPVAVVVNGIAAEVLGAVGYPGSTDAYQVNFRVPAETVAGAATLSISSAWIPSSSMTIPVR